MCPSQPPQPHIQGEGVGPAGEETVRCREERLLAREQAAEVSTQLAKDANGRLVVAMLRSQELAEEAEGFRLLVESVKDHAIFMLDPAGRVATWNPGADRITGYTPGEIIGQT